MWPSHKMKHDSKMRNCSKSENKNEPHTHNTGAKEVRQKDTEHVFW